MYSHPTSRTLTQPWFLCHESQLQPGLPVGAPKPRKMKVLNPQYNPNIWVITPKNEGFPWVPMDFAEQIPISLLTSPRFHWVSPLLVSFPLSTEVASHGGSTKGGGWRFSDQQTINSKQAAESMSEQAAIDHRR